MVIKYQQIRNALTGLFFDLFSTTFCSKRRFVGRTYRVVWQFFGLELGGKKW
jgi:hypothetical protein